MLSPYWILTAKQSNHEDTYFKSLLKRERLCHPRFPRQHNLQLGNATTGVIISEPLSAVQHLSMYSDRLDPCPRAQSSPLVEKTGNGPLPRPPSVCFRTAHIKNSK